eukprot:647805-Pyramimonas_sp.AAC.1
MNSDKSRGSKQSSNMGGAKPNRPSVPEFAQLQACGDDTGNPVMARAIAEANQVANGGSPSKGAGERWELSDLQALRSGVLRRRKAAHTRLEVFQKVREQLEDWHGHVSVIEHPSPKSFRFR